MEKRKKLESFAHPRIGQEFVRLVYEHASKNPDAVIQVVVPLLIEFNMQHIFHKILVVYIPEEMQIERLMTRDGIPRDMAANMISAQMPIEEKRGYADYVVDNSGSLEETRKQVEKIWGELKKIQEEGRS